MQPITRYVAHSWLVKAEQLAKVPHLKRGAWHPYRRGWATRKKHLPNQIDVAHASAC